MKCKVQVRKDGEWIIILETDDRDIADMAFYTLRSLSQSGLLDPDVDDFCVTTEGI